MYKKSDLLKKILTLLNQNSSMDYVTICKKLQISRTTAYKLFATKKDMIHEIITTMFEENTHFFSALAQNASLSTQEKLHESVIFMTDQMYSYYFVYSSSYLEENQAFVDAYEKQYYFVYELLENLQKKGEIHSHVDINRAVYVLYGLVVAGREAQKNKAFSSEQGKKHIYTTRYSLLGLSLQS